MKKFLEKIIRPGVKPELFLGFSGSHLKWVFSNKKKDSSGRVIVDNYGTIHNFAALDWSHFPKDFRQCIKKSLIHYVMPAGVSTRGVVSETVSMKDVRENIPGYVVHQNILNHGDTQPLYHTTSIDMDRISPEIETLKTKKINVQHVHHVSEGFIKKNIGLEYEHAMFVVSIGEVFSWVAWISHGQVLYQQDIELGRKDLINAIQNKVGISPEVAKNILVKYGLTRSHADKSVLEVLYKIFQPITQIMNEWVVAHSHFTYIKRSVQVMPHMIFITGSAADIPGIEQYFVLQTGIPTENIKDQTLRDYVTKNRGHVSELAEYQSLIQMIQ